MAGMKGEVVSVHAGAAGGAMRDARRIAMKLDGVEGDRHRSYTRIAWRGDKQPEGTERRNERQWSAVSQEELDEITADMDLDEPLTASALRVNLCIRGIAEFSRLPKGTRLVFPSGAELTVVEYNPPCREQGESIAALYVTRSGTRPTAAAFSRAAKLRRGVVGVVDVAGEIAVGDAVEVHAYAPPPWLARTRV